MMGGNPMGMFQGLMQGNPAFRQFVADNRGKTPEQVAAEHGIDLGQVRSLMGR